MAILICLLPAVVLTNTGYKLIILELRKNSSGQINSIQNHFQFKLFVCFLSKISLPNPLNQADRETLAVEIFLRRFRFILDSTALNPIVISDSALTQFGNRSINSVD